MVNPYRYLSVCSGIEAFTVAVRDLNFEAAAFSEIEPFPCSVLAHHYGASRPQGLPLGVNPKAFKHIPETGRVPNLGDMTQIDTREMGRVDWLVGGVPCQSYSVAGLRQGLNDERGNLTLEFVRLAHELATHNGLRGLLFENVPGILSDKTNAFGCLLGGLVGHDAPLVTPHGGRWPDLGMVAGPRARLAWRILNSQHFGVPQRRRRVYLVADFGDGPDPAAVLFEPGSQGWGAEAGGQAGEELAGTISARTKGGGGLGTDMDLAGGLQVSPPVSQHHAKTGNERNEADRVIVTHALTGEGFDASEDGSGRGTPLVVDIAPTISKGSGGRSPGLDSDTADSLVAYLGNAEGGNPEVPSLNASNGKKGINNQTALVAVFDPNQITNPDNRSDPAVEMAHSLPSQGNAPVLFSITPSNSNEDFNARETDHAQALTSGGNRPSARGGDLIAFTSKDHGADASDDLSPTLRASGHSASHANGGSPPAIAFHPQASQSQAMNPSETVPTLDKSKQAAVAFNLRGREGGSMPELGTDQASALRSADGGSSAPMALTGPQVRRLTPTECERLQGFPDNYTLIPGLSGWRDLGDDEVAAALTAQGLTVKKTKSGKWRVNDPDGPRYKALGNSFTSNVVRWIMIGVRESLNGTPESIRKAREMDRARGNYGPPSLSEFRAIYSHGEPAGAKRKAG